MGKIPKIIEAIKKYTPQEINYAFQKGISYSQLSMYYSCPKKWSLQYKEGHKIYTPTINTVFGTAMHETLQHYLGIMYTESGTKANELNIEEYFEDRFRETYQSEYESNKSIHFSNSEEMKEFFDDGLAILSFIKKRRNEYFTVKGWHLVGIEIPIVIPPNKTHNNVLFNGYIDLVLYHEPTDKFVIYDFKTSSRGWGDKEKKDEIKQTQLLLYKQFFHEQFGVPIEHIDIEFFILKRKIWEESEYPQKRIQSFVPANGKTKVKKAKVLLEAFINETFNLDGTHKDVEHNATPSKESCKYCPFSKGICTKAVH